MDVGRRFDNPFEGVNQLRHHHVSRRSSRSSESAHKRHSHGTRREFHYKIHKNRESGRKNSVSTTVEKRDPSTCTGLVADIIHTHAWFYAPSWSR